MSTVGLPLMAERRPDFVTNRISEEYKAATNLGYVRTMYTRNGRDGEYWFRGHPDLNGLDIVTQHLSQTASEAGSPHVVDIGTARGGFLHAVRASASIDGAVELTGISAFDYRQIGANVEGINYVVNNAEDPTVVAALSPIDVGLSSHTFMHFIDPVAAIENIAGQLRLGGEFWVDHCFTHGLSPLTLQNLCTEQGYPAHVEAGPFPHEIPGAFIDGICITRESTEPLRLPVGYVENQANMYGFSYTPI